MSLNWYRITCYEGTETRDGQLSQNHSKTKLVRARNEVEAFSKYLFGRAKHPTMQEILVTYTLGKGSYIRPDPDKNTILMCYADYLWQEPRCNNCRHFKDFASKHDDRSEYVCTASDDRPISSRFNICCTHKFERNY